MTARRMVLIFVILSLVLTLAGCSAAKQALPQSAEALNSLPGDPAVQAGGLPEKGPAGGLIPTGMSTSADPAKAQIPAADGGATGAATAGEPPLIIKQAQIRLQVKDTDQAIDRLTQVVSDTGGYIVSNRVWFEPAGGESFKYATFTIAVPVDGFEVALRRLRALALKVVDETAGGQDVSEEYVDLESRLANLQATRDRIRGFLDRAQTVEESLRINTELAAIEEQIEQVEGRMRWLAGRAAFSTITVQLDPELPPAPVPPTPTPTPEPVPYQWDPGRTFDHASGLAVKVGQFLVDAFIYLVVWVPFAIPAAAVWLIYAIITRKRKPASV